MEDKTKNKWLIKLKSIDFNWKDGDLSNQNKTADLINDNLKLAIELKSDTVFKIKSETETSCITLSNRWKGYAKDANSKFNSYPSYRTILLIECEIPDSLLQRIFIGTPVLKIPTKGSFLKNKNLREHYSNIGCYLMMSKSEGIIDGFYYFKNPAADKKRILEKAEVGNILNITISSLFQENL
jgi:hypothetical protein